MTQDVGALRLDRQIYYGTSCPCYYCAPDSIAERLLSCHHACALTAWLQYLLHSSAWWQLSQGHSHYQVCRKRLTLLSEGVTGEGAQLGGMIQVGEGWRSLLACLL